MAPLATAPVKCLVLLASLLAILSGCTLDRPRTSTHTDYLKHRLEEPKVCIAFSGGGVRSASITIGVLRELHHDGMLRKVDIASGASGGSWGLFWLYTHAARSSLTDVFGMSIDSTSRALEQPENTEFMNKLARAGTALASVVRAARSALYGGINTTFGTKGVIARYTSPNAVLATAQERSLPVPIFAVTALRSNCDTGNDHPRLSMEQLNARPMDERLTELMPLTQYAMEIHPGGWGNEFYGYSSQFPSPVADIENWAMSSGAFVDEPKYSNCPLLAAIGATWGTDATIVPDDASFPTRNLYLADGGFSENLAGFPLLRRTCSVTVLVDAEYDPNFTFEGYRRLQRGAREAEALGAMLQVPAIDDWISQNPSGAINAARDPSLSIVKDPVAAGTIVRRAGNVDHVLYLKLSIDAARLNEYSADTKAAYEASLKCKPGVDCTFPHTDTFNTSYSPAEFRAHRDLGSALTKWFLAPKLETFLSSVDGRTK